MYYDLSNARGKHVVACSGVFYITAGGACVRVFVIYGDEDLHVGFWKIIGECRGGFLERNKGFDELYCRQFGRTILIHVRIMVWKWLNFNQTLTEL